MQGIIYIFEGIVQEFIEYFGTTLPTVYLIVFKAFCVLLTVLLTRVSTINDLLNFSQKYLTQIAKVEHLEMNIY